MAAFVNKGYGYLAPVEQNIEAWIQLEYPEYAQEQGIHHTFPIQTSEFLLQIWFLSMRLPLIKYLCTPGLYTWILVVLAFSCGKEKIQCVDTAGSRIYKRVGVPGIPHVQCNPL